MDLLFEGATKGEDPEQYDDLLTRLTTYYQPVGAAEELEVQRMAICWWRFRRAWRFENAEIAHKHINIDEGCDDLLNPNMKTPFEAEHSVIGLLKKVAGDIESHGEIKDVLKQEMMSASGRFQQIWSAVEALAKKEVSSIKRRKKKHVSEAGLSPETQTLLNRTQITIAVLESRMRATVKDATRFSGAGSSVLEMEALDRLLRAEAAAERSLNRAVDRLERLQRRRRGELIPPPVSVRLGI